MAKKGQGKYLAILDAAIKVIARHGYHRTRVSEIARKAGVADGTVYLYFNKKEDILISLFREMMESFVDGLKSELNNYSTFEEKLRYIINYHLETLSANRDRAMVTQIELRQCDADVGKKIFAPLSKYFQIIEEVIQYGKTTGEVRTEVDNRLARKIIFGSLDEVVTRWVMSQKDYSLSQLSDPLLVILMNGVSAPPQPSNRGLN